MKYIMVNIAIHPCLQLLVLDSVLAWAGVVDELDFAKRLKDWCQRGYPELGDNEGIVLSSTIQKVRNSVHTFPHSEFILFLYLENDYLNLSVFVYVNYCLR